MVPFLSRLAPYDLAQNRNLDNNLDNLDNNLDNLDNNLDNLDNNLDKTWTPYDLAQSHLDNNLDKTWIWSPF